MALPFIFAARFSAAELAKFILLSVVLICSTAALEAFFIHQKLVIFLKQFYLPYFVADA